MKNIEKLLRERWECCNAIDRSIVNYACPVIFVKKGKENSCVDCSLKERKRWTFFNDNDSSIPLIVCVNIYNSYKKGSY